MLPVCDCCGKSTIAKHSFRGSTTMEPQYVFSQYQYLRGYGTTNRPVG